MSDDSPNKVCDGFAALKRPNGASVYGEIVMKRHDDGTVTVVSADDKIGIDTDLLPSLAPEHIQDGLFVADTAGEYVYKPWRFANGGRVVVCERVKTFDCECLRWATHFRIGFPNGHHPRCDKQPDGLVRARWDSGEYWRRDDAD